MNLKKINTNSKIILINTVFIAYSPALFLIYLGEWKMLALFLLSMTIFIIGIKISGGKGVINRWI